MEHVQYGVGLEGWGSASYGADGLLTAAMRPGTESLAARVAPALGSDVEVRPIDAGVSMVFLGGAGGPDAQTS